MLEDCHKIIFIYNFLTSSQDSILILKKGEIYWEKDQKEAPFSPSPIPPSTDVSKMLYIWLTEFTANSYAYAAQTHGYLSRNFTSQDVSNFFSPMKSSFLSFKSNLTIE